MKRLVIFGLGDTGELAHYYFSNDSEYTVAGFTVDAEHLNTSEFCGLPVVPFADAVRHFPPETTEFFAAVGYNKLNEIRRTKVEDAKALGYRIATYLSSYARVFPGFHLGENCFILEDNTIQPFARVGNNVTLWSGNHIGHHSTIGDHCFVASHVVISGGVTIGESCFIGVNATLRDRVSVGARSVIGAGALILADVEPEGVYLGAATERSKVPSSRLRRI